MDRTATVNWVGDLFTGKGSLTTESQALKDTPYSFKTRFESEKGTNPEELLAAALAACFTMSINGVLLKMGLKGERIDTKGVVTIDKVGEGFVISKSHLDIEAKIPGIDQNKLDEIIKIAETVCPVSNLYKTEKSVKAKLV